MLTERLQTFGAVLIEGSKHCGKSAAAAVHAKSVVLMEAAQTQQIAAIHPRLLLEGDVPRLIDEWQLAPPLWDAVRREVDRRGGEPGQFVLTGSEAPADRSSAKHSGTGRFGWLRMRPMTLFETGESSGGVSLSALFDGALDIGCVNALSLEAAAFAACRGGWPAALHQKGDQALRHAAAYFDAIVREDVCRADGIRRREDYVRKLMSAYARAQGSQISAPDIARDMGNGINDKTVLSYINALRQIFVIEDLPAWKPKLRTKTAIRSSDARYFVDPSIAAAALGAGPRDLLMDPESFGRIFKTLCIRDLRVYREAIDGSVYHYRDKSGLECDAVLRRRNGKYALIEIKLGSAKDIENGVKTLRALAEKIDARAMREPSFMMILTAAGDFAYRRDDGILVVPIGCLKP